MALYISLEPFTYQKDVDTVVHVLEAGRIVEMTSVQAALYPSKVIYWGSGSSYLAPQITMLSYDSELLFPNEGSKFHVYLDQATGRLWQWSHAEDEYTLVSIMSPVDPADIDGLTPTGEALLTAANQAAARTAIDAQAADPDLTALAALTAPATKLAGIEALADVTDAANVDAAGAVMNSDTGTGAMSFVIDEDSFATDSSTKIPTQQSVKAYVLAVRDALLASAPGVLDTLDEIAAALNDDPNFAATMTTTLAGKQGLDATLTALAVVTTAADKLIYANGSDSFVTTTFTSFMRTLLDDADATAARATLGLVIGTNVQAFNAALSTLGGLTATTDNFIVSVASAWASRTPAQVKTTLALNLVDNTSDATKRAPRVALITSSATPTFNTDNVDAVDITALATPITSMTSGRTGTLVNFQRLLVRIYSAAAQPIAWGSDYVSGSVELPPTTVAGKILMVGLIVDTAGKLACEASGSRA